LFCHGGVCGDEDLSRLRQPEGIRDALPQLLQLDELAEPGKQRSVAGDSYAVHYLGRFRYSGQLS
jgi:hypothetical protein